MNRQYNFLHQLGSHNCHHNVAQLRRLREQYPNELVVIGVHSAKFPSEKLTENIRQAVMRHGIEHPVVNDAGMKIWNAYAVRAWPTLVLIDPHGRIAGETSGEILAEDFTEQLNDLIRLNADTLDRTPLDLLPEIRVQPASPLRYPSRLLAAEDVLFIADAGHNRIIEVALDADGQGGEVRRVFGSGEAALRDGPAETAAFHHPHGLGLAGSPREGRLFVADTENHAVRVIDLVSGEVSTLAGTGEKGHGRAASGAPTEMDLRSPWAVLPLGDYLLVAMAGTHQIWVLMDDRRFGPFAGNGYEALEDGPLGEASFNQPSDLAFGMGYLFVADPEASAIRAISLGDAPQVMTLVGQGLFDWGDQDGSATEAMLQHPAGLTIDGQTLYVADTYNNKIKLLDPLAGQVQTLVGDGQPGSRDGSFEQARLFEPEGVYAYAGRLYVADTNNHRIRVADLTTRQVSTFQLRGLGRLPAAWQAEDEASLLAPQPVQAGRVRFTLDARLPEGYERNPEVETVIEVGAEGQAQRFSFDAGQPLTWEMAVEQDQRLPLNLTLYYCQKSDALLCLIYDRALLLPLLVQPGAPAQVTIPLEIRLPGAERAETG